MTGNDHAAGFYGSDAEFEALILPFVQNALRLDEPVIIGYDERKSDLIRSQVGNHRIHYVAEHSLYATPSHAIAAYGELFTQLTAAGAPRVWVAGDVPHAGNGGRFDGWDRYESALNTVWETFSVRSLCLYDRTTVSPLVRDVVERTHPWLHTAGGQTRRSDRYERPEAFTALAAVADPLERTAPRLEVVNAMPADARHAVASIARDVLTGGRVDDLLLAVSEAVTNARLHGREPYTVRMWTTSERVVVHVHDSGPGPRDRLAGLVPPPFVAQPGGRGVWLMHQLDIAVDLMTAPDGFTVRLRAGRGTPAVG